MSAVNTIRANASALLADLKSRNLEWKVPVVALLIVAAAWLFIALGDAVAEGDTKVVDQRILSAMRLADDPAVPIGPDWLATSARDITALGDMAVLSLLIVFTGLFLVLEHRWRAALFIVLATVTGRLMSSGLKLLFSRDRPELVPHLTEVSTASFPSGHSTMAAVVFLTLGLLLTRISTQKRTRIFILCVALLLTALVGCTRVYLGVHYPTDVLAGWLVGLSWALLCWAVFRLLQMQRIITGGDAEPPA